MMRLKPVMEKFTVDECYKSLQLFESNDGLTAQFYRAFCHNLGNLIHGRQLKLFF